MKQLLELSEFKNLASDEANFREYVPPYSTMFSVSTISIQQKAATLITKKKEVKVRPENSSEMTFKKNYHPSRKDKNMHWANAFSSAKKFFSVLHSLVRIFPVPS